MATVRRRALIFIIALKVGWPLLSAHEVMRAAFEGHKVTPVKEFQTKDYEALLRGDNPTVPNSNTSERSQGFSVFLVNPVSVTLA